MKKFKSVWDVASRKVGSPNPGRIVLGLSGGLASRYVYLIVQGGRDGWNAHRLPFPQSTARVAA